MRIHAARPIGARGARGVNKNDFTIGGIGSFAGGLEAIRELVATLSTALNMIYVVVQKMSPHHKKLMTELMICQTSPDVSDEVDRTMPQASVIFVKSPNMDIIYDYGLLRLVEPSLEFASPKPYVNRLLLSLADKHGEASMGIFLSVTGSDGEYGTQANRKAGGITIAQDTDSAKFDGMPMTTVQTGCVDLVFRSLEIRAYLQKILTLARDFYAFRQEASEISPTSKPLPILVVRVREDIRDYKQTRINTPIEI